MQRDFKERSKQLYEANRKNWCVLTGIIWAHRRLLICSSVREANEKKHKVLSMLKGVRRDAFCVSEAGQEKYR
jgi:hypothetical protein